MSTTDRVTVTGPPHEPQEPPYVTLPVLVCLPHPAAQPPTTLGELGSLIGLAVIGNGPNGAAFRVGGRYAGLLRHRPHPPAVFRPMLINSDPEQRPPVCDGGTLAWLESVPAHVGDGLPLRVVTPDGRWFGPLPWLTAPYPPAPPPPVARLRRLPAWTVVVLTELNAPLRPDEVRRPPWETRPWERSR